MSRPHIGQYAPLPRPTARRMSDLNPHARLSVPHDPDRPIGIALRIIGVVLAIGLLAGAL